MVSGWIKLGLASSALALLCLHLLTFTLPPPRPALQPRPLLPSRTTTARLGTSPPVVSTTSLPSRRAVALASSPSSPAVMSDSQLVDVFLQRRQHIAAVCSQYRLAGRLGETLLPSYQATDSRLDQQIRFTHHLLDHKHKVSCLHYTLLFIQLRFL